VPNPTEYAASIRFWAASAQSSTTPVSGSSPRSRSVPGVIEELEPSSVRLARRPSDSGPAGRAARSRTSPHRNSVEQSRIANNGESPRLLVEALGAWTAASMRRRMVSSSTVWVVKSRADRRPEIAALMSIDWFSKRTGSTTPRWTGRTWPFRAYSIERASLPAVLGVPTHDWPDYCDDPRLPGPEPAHASRRGPYGVTFGPPIEGRGISAGRQPVGI